MNLIDEASVFKLSNHLFSQGGGEGEGLVGGGEGEGVGGGRYVGFVSYADRVDGWMTSDFCSIKQYFIHNKAMGG